MREFFCALSLTPRALLFIFTAPRVLDRHKKGAVCIFLILKSHEITTLNIEITSHTVRLILTLRVEVFLLNVCSQGGLFRSNNNNNRIGLLNKNTHDSLQL